MRLAWPTGTSCSSRKLISRLMPFCSLQACVMEASFFGEMPRTSFSCSGLSSMTRSVPSPKRSTMRLASTGPMPGTSPEPR